MKYQDLVVKKTWEQNGEEKTKWLNVGTIRTTDDGKQYAEINLLPETTIYVFDQKPRENKPQTQKVESVDLGQEGEF